MTTNVFVEGNFVAAATDLGLPPNVVAACEVLNTKTVKRDAWTPPVNTGPTNAEILKRETEAENPLVAERAALMAALSDVNKALGLNQNESKAYPDDDQESREISYIRDTLASMTITENNPYGIITVEQARQFALTVPRYNGREFKIKGEARATAAK